MKLIVDNVRIGHATNSSSSHSFIVLPNYNKGYNDSQTYIDPDQVVYGEFGWEWFTLESKLEKLTYLAIMVRDSMLAHVPQEVATDIVRDWLGVTLDNDAYIDHQSRIPDESFKSYYTTQFFTSKKFVQAFKEWILRDDVLVLGGNDNDGDVHRLDNGTSFTMPYDMSYNTYRIRYDDKYQFWSLYNPENGNKVRFRFEDLGSNFTQDEYGDTQDASFYVDKGRLRYTERQNIGYQRSSVPELVDLKVTDYCSFGCKFCYQGSTEEGKHADDMFVRHILRSLGKLGTFEVALGGGETTDYPYFEEIMQVARNEGIIPNFTTKSFEWLKDEERAKRILNLCGAFAFSISGVNDIDKLMAYKEILGFKHEKVNLHVVMGTVTRDRFKKILEKAKENSLRVTLLGFKLVHRGVDYKIIDYDWWYDVCSEVYENGYSGVSVDTSMIEQYRDLLYNRGVPSWMYHYRDGTFSAYIDCVDQTIAPSSYANLDQAKKFSDRHWDYTDDIEYHFNKFEV